MKIKDINRSWQAFAVGLSKLIRVEQAANSRKVSKPNVDKFSSWPRTSRHNMPWLEPGLKTHNVDVELLEQFLKEILPREISYNDLISCQLQLGTKGSSIANLSKMMDIKNLGDLVNASVKEMKMIGINHIISNRA